MRTHENSAMASLDENLEQVEKELLEEADVVEEVYEKVVVTTNVSEMDPFFNVMFFRRRSSRTTKMKTLWSKK